MMTDGFRHILFLQYLFWLSLSVAAAGPDATDEDVDETLPYDTIMFKGPHEAFETANSLYAAGYFEDAINWYEMIISEGYHSSGIYYNLGNAYYRSNKIPGAIINYERAALLAPRDEDIRFNLSLARGLVRDRIEELPDFFLNRWWKSLRDLNSAGGWALISAASFITFLLMLLVFLISASASVKRVFFWLAVSVFFVSLFSFSLGIDRRNYIRNHNGAIVFSPVVSVKSSPDINSTELFVIHEGSKVWVEDSIGDWQLIRLIDGNKGWILKHTIERI